MIEVPRSHEEFKRHVFYVLFEHESIHGHWPLFRRLQFLLYAHIYYSPEKFRVNVPFRVNPAMATIKPWKIPPKRTAETKDPHHLPPSSSNTKMVAFDKCETRPAHIEAILNGLDRYNPETTTVFQDYVALQCEDRTFDCYANLALLKL
jgi:hypothetical protein